MILYCIYYHIPKIGFDSKNVPRMFHRTPTARDRDRVRVRATKIVIQSWEQYNQNRNRDKPPKGIGFLKKNTGA